MDIKLTKEGGAYTLKIDDICIENISMGEILNSIKH